MEKVSRTEHKIILCIHKKVAICSLTECTSITNKSLSCKWHWGHGSRQTHLLKTIVHDCLKKSEKSPWDRKL